MSICTINACVHICAINVCEQIRMCDKNICMYVCMYVCLHTIYYLSCVMNPGKAFVSRAAMKFTFVFSSFRVLFKKRSAVVRDIGVWYKVTPWKGLVRVRVLKESDMDTRYTGDSGVGGASTFLFGTPFPHNFRQCWMYKRLPQIQCTNQLWTYTDDK